MQGAGCWLPLQPRLTLGAGRGWYCNVWQVPRSWLCTTHFLQALQTHGGIAQCPVNSSSTHFRPSAGKPCCPSTYHVSTDKPLPDICVAGAYCNGYPPNGTCVMVGGGVGFGGDSALNLFVALYVNTWTQRKVPVAWLDAASLKPGCPAPAATCRTLTTAVWRASHAAS